MVLCRLLRCLFPYYMLFLFILPSVSLSQPRANISSSSLGAGICWFTAVPRTVSGT